MDTDTDTDDVDTDTAVIKVRWDTTEITSYETTFTAADLADMGITGDGLAAVLSAAESGALTDRLGPGELGDYEQEQTEAGYYECTARVITALTALSVENDERKD